MERIWTSAKQSCTRYEAPSTFLRLCDICFSIISNLFLKQGPKQTAMAIFLLNCGELLKKTTVYKLVYGSDVLFLYLSVIEVSFKTSHHLRCAHKSCIQEADLQHATF